MATKSTETTMIIHITWINVRGYMITRITKITKIRNIKGTTKVTDIHAGTTRIADITRLLILQELAKLQK